MKKVVLDTNFLLLPHTEKIDVFTEIERLVRDEHETATLSGVIDELAAIKENKNSSGRDKVAANVALLLLQKKSITVIDGVGRVDEQIVEYAAKEPQDTIVCTNDRILRKKLRKARVALIGMRGRTHLDFV